MQSRGLWMRTIKQHWLFTPNFSYLLVEPFRLGRSVRCREHDEGIVLIIEIILGSHRFSWLTGLQVDANWISPLVGLRGTSFVNRNGTRIVGHRREFRSRLGRPMTFTNTSRFKLTPIELSIRPQTTNMLGLLGVSSSFPIRMQGAKGTDVNQYTPQGLLQ